MNEALEKIRQEALARLQEVCEEKELEELNSSVLGRSGSLTGILRTMGQLDKEQRAKLGQASNAVKKELEQAIAERRAKIAQLMQQKAFEKETLDVTEPGIRRQPSGRLHPMTQTYREIRDALIGMGFTTFHGPEVEYDDFNFTKLNLPKDHPARDMQDTFYVNDKVVLRTHTSPCEARALMNVKPPFRLVIPGRVFRVDEVDASHSPVFMQMEGLVVDKNISFADLKGTLDEFVHTVFGPDVKTRMRPSYFPFTEPSAEVDISCTICGGKGCRVCKGTGWLEILGCGVTNPHELENCGLDPHEWSAFAFGIGVDRVTSLKYGINDIRLEYENDARFLGQF
ncbi:MAG: phenylalanine--tRNA ligase subunit alpha [Eubacteriales bacterium]|nr:phenylalanine--tRNA ligase subunit alpha [Christensenellaceae bacterium]MDY4695873.1 phenylalanine--tRNA ligase subunit alpha [Eubacteriales bacterium]